VPVLASYVMGMRMTPTRSFAIALTALSAAFLAAPAHAQNSYDIMVEEGGRPLKRPQRVDPKSDADPKKRTEPKARPRGSSGYVAPTPLPRTGPIVTSPAPEVYRPPPINSFSDRVTNCNHSFPLNAGVGNNPTDRSAYVRQCAN